MSQLEVNKIIPQSGTTLTIGDSGDTISFASGVLPSLESLTITGDLTVDTNTLYVDSTNNRVGVGTASPTTELEVEGDISIKGAGNKLFIPRASDGAQIGEIFSSVDNDLTLSARGSGSGFIRFEPSLSSGEAMRIDSSGNVGIGTSSPDASARLTVSKGSSGGSANSNAGIVIEDNSNTYLNLMSPNGFNNGIYFGDAADNDIGYINYAHGSNSMAFGVNASERMRIDSSGNVGINTNNPTQKLQVNGNGFFISSTSLRIDVDDGAGPVISQQSSSADTLFIRSFGNIELQADSNNNSGQSIIFKEGGSESMRIDGARRIGMAMSSVATVRLAVASDTSFIMIGRDSTGTTDKFRIEADGDVRNTNNSYGAISDRNLKQDITNASSQWEDIKALQVKNYRLIKEVEDNADSPRHIGVIAQDLEESNMSGLVKESPKQNLDGTYSETETEKNVKYSVLYMKAVKALQEAMTRIESLETENTSIKARLTTLENA